MRTIGVIGGLGPMATAYFLELITRMTDAENDQAHPRIFMESIPDTPDRTGFIVGRESESPLPGLVRAGRELAGLGADFIAIPCVTAHYFYDGLAEALPVPVLSITRLAAEAVEGSARRVGLLATSGTVRGDVLGREFARVGVEVIEPSPGEQELVMELIGQIKRGREVDWRKFEQVSCSLTERGAQKLVLGCTELSLLKRERPLAGNYVDALELLARQAVLMSGAELRREYR